MININKIFYRTSYVKKYLFTTNIFFYTLNNINSMDNDNKNKLFEDNKNKSLEDNEDKVLEDIVKKLFGDNKNNWFGDNENKWLEDNKNKWFEDIKYKWFGDNENKRIEDNENNWFEDIEYKLFEDNENKRFEDNENKWIEYNENKWVGYNEIKWIGDNKIKWVGDNENNLFEDIFDMNVTYKKNNSNISNFNSINDKFKPNKFEEKSSENTDLFNYNASINNKKKDILNFNHNDKSNININLNFNFNLQLDIPNSKENINTKTKDNKFIGKKCKRSEPKTTIEKKEINENHKIVNEFFSDYLCRNLNGCTNNKKYNKTLDITKYLNVEDQGLVSDSNEVDEYPKILNDMKQGEKIFIQSDTEGRFSNIFSILKRINIIDTNKTCKRYYNFLNGKFQTCINEDIPYITLNLFEVINNFKGKYFHLGDIIDRCGSKQHECLLSLLFLIYLKQELPNNVNLICGNHELTCYFNDKESLCCQDIKPLLTHIVFKAIANGQIKFFDTITLGKERYILTHKVIYKDDIRKLSQFISNYNFFTFEKDKNIETICNSKCYYGKALENLALLENKKDIDFTAELVNITKDIKPEDNIYTLMENINKLFELHFRYYFAEIYPKKEFFNNLTDFVNKMYFYSKDFNVLNPNKKESIMDGTRVREKGYENCVNNQIAGHDHHDIFSYVIKRENILFVDNYSHLIYDKNKTKNLATLHIFNEKDPNDRNYIQITTPPTYFLKK